MTGPGPPPAVVVHGARGRGRGDRIQLRLGNKRSVGHVVQGGGHDLELGARVNTRDVLGGQDRVGRAIGDVRDPPLDVRAEYPIGVRLVGAPSGVYRAACGPEVIRPRIAVA